ncbi:protein of unknown function [Taphrina deformans PYCC 5710]|uniref:Uncharacterized protein n=1 Tax=Taphrina deformans (strain PYCC 5710 / ATCC 11124 / CBS 356.35 / IMI 108563 / JCM 9778 / NBRC 8474) TaxID=1097556 RepID=R4XA26_TAPDE|nr:protein of unknown function [Taphrina deformans PYCC 5710]|eukprot:CCG82638.1 protein of unknown function [Taphrina deformans PYCC 5710]
MSSHRRSDSNGPRVLIQSGASYVASIDNRITIHNGGVYHVEHHYPPGYQGSLAHNTANSQALSRFSSSRDKTESEQISSKGDLRTEQTTERINSKHREIDKLSIASVTALQTGAGEDLGDSQKPYNREKYETTVSGIQISPMQECDEAGEEKVNLAKVQGQTVLDGSDCIVDADPPKMALKKSTRARRVLKDATTIVSLDTNVTDRIVVNSSRHGKSQKARVKKEIIEQ